MNDTKKLKKVVADRDEMSYSVAVAVATGSRATRQELVKMILESRASTLGVYAKVEVKQLDYCNAFIRSCYLQDGDGVVLAKRELVSYCTPVLSIAYRLDGTEKYLICSQAAICSATTRKHVGRFLNRYLTTVGYYTIKKALETPAEHGYMNGLRLIDLKHNTVRDFRDDSGMFKVRYESIKPFKR